MKSILAVLGLLLMLATWASAEQKTCTTTYDEQAKRWLTRCSDGSRSVTTYDEQARRFYTKEVVPSRDEKSKR